MALDRPAAIASPESTNAAPPNTRGDYKIWQVISASAVGTMIEWYDFYIFGSLATVISPSICPACYGIVRSSPSPLSRPSRAWLS
jgi:hypothetical protein